MKVANDSLAAVESFYAAMIRDIKLGPRHELTLDIETFPKSTHYFKDGKMITIRFGAISNYGEVQEFFAKIPFESLHYLREITRSGSHRIFEMEFDGTGKQIQIVAGNIAIQT
jgi:hypothetical protein